DICYRYDVDGCSIPFQLPFFFKDLFTHSCARHDICYHCGVGELISRATCDLSFRNDTTTSCKLRYLTPEQSGGLLSYVPGLGKPSSTSHKQRLVEVVDDHEDELAVLLQEELKAFNSSQSNPSQSAYFVFFDIPRTTKVLVKWIELMKNDLSSLEKGSRGARRKRRFLVDDLRYVEGVIEKTICSTIYAATSLFRVTLDCKDIGYLACHFFSEIYYLGVHVFGGPNYHRSSEYYCKENFVPKCLPGSSL
ncbi:unnamed protein product, partial [Lymnaea stagnalis]